jgi:hypothetical protein
MTCIVDSIKNWNITKTESLYCIVQSVHIYMQFLTRFHDLPMQITTSES